MSVNKVQARCHLKIDVSLGADLSCNHILASHCTRARRRRAITAILFGHGFGLHLQKFPPSSTSADTALRMLDSKLGTNLHRSNASTIGVVRPQSAESKSISHKRTRIFD